MKSPPLEENAETEMPKLIALVLWNVVGKVQGELAGVGVVERDGLIDALPLARPS